MPYIWIDAELNGLQIDKKISVEVRISPIDIVETLKMTIYHKLGS